MREWKEGEKKGGREWGKKRIYQNYMRVNPR